MRKSMTILAVAVLMLTPMIFADADADASDAEKCRFCDKDLYHCVGTAVASDVVKNNLWVYPLGEDASMKAYIADPQNAPRPDKGLKEVVEGEEYEVYCFIEPGWPFEYPSLQKVLGAYSYEFSVKEKTVEKLTVTKLKDSSTEFSAYILEYHGDQTLTQYCSVGITVTLNHYRDGGYYEMRSNYYSEDLFVEAEYEISVKEFTGSPYLYIGLCIGITAAIALLIFWCGRKPKL